MGAHLFEDLPRVLEGYKSQMYSLVTLLAQRSALAAGDYVARETPVDTGRARSNWVMTLQEPFTGIIPAYVPYPSYRQNNHEPVKVFTFSTRRAKTRVRVFGGP